LVNVGVDADANCACVRCGFICLPTDCSTAVAHLAFIFCCFVWGSTFILLERVTHVFGAVEIALWRLFSGALVVGFFWWRKRGESRLARHDWLWLAFAALAFTAPPQVIQAYVLSQGFGHSFFGTMVAAIPLLTILVSVPMLGTLPTGRELFGVLGGLVCMLLLLEDGVHRGMSTGLLALTFIIPLSSALSNTFIKWKLRHVPAAPLTTTLLVAAACALLPLQFSPQSLAALHISPPTGASVTSVSMIYLLLLGVVGSGLSTMVFIWMILKKGPLFAGMTTYVVPVLALLWGTVDNEKISSEQMVAIAGVLAMVALVQTASPADAAAGEPAPAGDLVTSLPISAEAAELVSLPLHNRGYADAPANDPESQVA
jgi:drug/metabolite transporter (DMT)-like permease